MVDRYDRNITLVSAIQRCQPCCQNDLAAKRLCRPRKGRQNLRQEPLLGTYSVNKASRQVVHVEIMSLVKL